MESLARFFMWEDRGSSFGQELRAGLTTFLSMAYIIVVNPAILSNAGIDPTACATATALGAAIMTILMGLIANRPLALASGLGVNAMIAFTGTAMAGGDWYAAMSVIFLEGIAILILVLCGLREQVMAAIPVSQRHAISIGLGFFIALIGLVNAGIIVDDPSTLIALGDVLSPTFIVGIVSIFATAILSALNVNGAILLGIVIAVIVGIPLGVTQIPSAIVAGLDLSTIGVPFKTFEGSDTMGIVKCLTNVEMLVFAFSLMMSDFFDTMGTALAVGKQGEFLNEDGSVQNIKEILIVDSAAAAVGGLFGVSSITTFVESASGAADGGRTGLTSVTCGVLFILAAFFAPLTGIVSTAATCGALVFVGYLMMSEVTEINWGDILEGFPAFMTAAGVAFTYSISAGIGLGFISYAIIALITGKAKEVKPLMWVACLAFLIYFLV